MLDPYGSKSPSLHRALFKMAAFNSPGAFLDLFRSAVFPPSCFPASFIIFFRSCSCAFSIAFFASRNSFILVFASSPCLRLSAADRRRGNWMIAENASKTFCIGWLWRSATAAKGKFSWHVSAMSTILDVE